MGEALDGRHPAMLDGAALEERWQVLQGELVEACRVSLERLKVEACQVSAQVPGPGTALRAGWFSPGPDILPADASRGPRRHHGTQCPCRSRCGAPRPQVSAKTGIMIAPP
jgi:hypothetical protein